MLAWRGQVISLSAIVLYNYGRFILVIIVILAGGLLVFNFFPASPFFFYFYFSYMSEIELLESLLVSINQLVTFSSGILAVLGLILGLLFFNLVSQFLRVW